MKIKNIFFLQFVCQVENYHFEDLYSDFHLFNAVFLPDLKLFCSTKRQVVNVVRGNTPHLRALSDSSSSDLDDEKIDPLREAR